MQSISALLVQLRQQNRKQAYWKNWETLNTGQNKSLARVLTSNFHNSQVNLSKIEWCVCFFCKLHSVFKNQHSTPKFLQSIFKGINCHTRNLSSVRAISCSLVLSTNPHILSPPKKFNSATKKLYSIHCARTVHTWSKHFSKIACKTKYLTSQKTDNKFLAINYTNILKS